MYCIVLWDRPNAYSMQAQKVMEQLGYSKKEAKVYLTVLRLGEAHISDIAKSLSLPRSSVQAIVDRLHADGLMNFYVMRRYKCWVAEHPEQLLNKLQTRESSLKEVLPVLTEMRRQAHVKRRYDSKKPTKLGPLEFIADSLVLPVLITDDEASIMYVNQAWEHQFGYRLKEVKGKSLRLLKSGQTPPEVFRQVWESLSKDRLFQSDEIIDYRKDGTAFNLATSIFSVHIHNQLFYIQILDDITERKRLGTTHKIFLNVSSNLSRKSDD